MHMLTKGLSNQTRRVHTLVPRSPVLKSPRVSEARELDAHLARSLKHTWIPGAPSLIGLRVLDASHIDGSLQFSPWTTRQLSSLKLLEASSDHLNALKEDMNTIHHRAKEVLREYITSPEMYNIATYYYTAPKDNFLIWTGLPLLIGKAVKYHMFQNGTLTEDQLKALTIVQLIVMFYLLNDDVSDNAKIRFNLPAANVLWHPYKVIWTANMIFAITVSEAAKLPQNVTASLCHMHESQYRGQYMTEEQTISHGDKMAHYLALTDFKGGCTVHYSSKALCETLGASALLTDVVTRMGTNFGMTGQLLDDFKDIEADLKDGLATAPVLFAMKEHPQIEEMIQRKFKANGDVQRTMKLVFESQAIEETQNLARRYFNTALSYLRMLAESPYRDALEMVAHIQFERKINFYEHMERRQYNKDPLSVISTG